MVSGRSCWWLELVAVNGTFKETEMRKDHSGINPASKPSGDGCVECLASPRGYAFISAVVRSAVRSDTAIVPRVSMHQSMQRRLEAQLYLLPVSSQARSRIRGTRPNTASFPGSRTSGLQIRGRPDRSYAAACLLLLRNARRSALIVAASVVGMPWGKFL